MPKVTKRRREFLKRAQKCHEVIINRRHVLGEIDQNTQTQDVNSQSNVSLNITNEDHESQTKHILPNQGVLEKVLVSTELKSTLGSQECKNYYELETTTEQDKEHKEKHVGRRIVNITYFPQHLLAICNHGPLGCSASDIKLTGEKQIGFISKFTFKCKMCNENFTIQNDNCEDNFLNLNACAVAGTVAIGCGRSQLEELCSAMNLPSLGKGVYSNNHDIISKYWEKTLVENIAAAGRREKELALAQGKVTKE